MTNDTTGASPAAAATAKLPSVLVTSVIRSSHKGESHGGVYLLDLETGEHDLVIDWNAGDIDWSGRGGDRGLRGIAFHRDAILMAASDEILVYDHDFSIRGSLRNRYLRHCHEIHVADDRLYLTSTGYDSVLVYDLNSEQFVDGLHLARPLSARVLRKLRRIGIRARPTIRRFDPNSDGGPPAGDHWHVNNVYVDEGTIYASGTQLGHILVVEPGGRPYARIPYATHNARPYADGALFNDTEHNRVVLLDRRFREAASFAVPRYREAQLVHADLPEKRARPSFGRGLCVHHDRFLIAGSSPATVTVYDLATRQMIKSIQLSNDVRNAVHGLEVYSRPASSNGRGSVDARAAEPRG